MRTHHHTDRPVPMPGRPHHPDRPHNARADGRQVEPVRPKREVNMRCYVCTREVEDNPFADLDDTDTEMVVSEYTLVRCTGTDDEFDADGTVVVCGECIGMAQHLKDDPMQYDGPSTEDMFPVGERAIVRHPFSDKEVGRGVITGHTTGWYDFGSPESGPGPVEETEMITVALEKRAPISGRLLSTESKNIFPGNIDLERDA